MTTRLQKLSDTYFKGGCYTDEELRELLSLQHERIKELCHCGRREKTLPKIVQISTNPNDDVIFLLYDDGKVYFAHPSGAGNNWVFVNVPLPERKD